MRLSRLGSLHQSRLSFMRVLTRRMARETWRFSRPVFDIDAKGVGRAVYTASGPDRSYSLVAFAHDLPAEQRSDRVIAEAWDATFTLFDGVPTEDDLNRLSRNVPLQEAGRVSGREISLSRANRSVRLWDHVVEALAAGHQPDPAKLQETGYFMRTTAVYGSGKFGAADRERIADRPEMETPFQAEMLSVYLTRTFVRDLAEHMARARGGSSAVRLDPQIARTLGIGNSTGLGMAPFLINHPLLFNNWIAAREEAIGRVLSLPKATKAEQTRFRDLLGRSRHSVRLWQSAHPLQQDKVKACSADLEALTRHLDSGVLDMNAPWGRLHRWADEALSEEGQELLLSLILEPYDDLVDALATEMADHVDDTHQIDGAMAVGRVRMLIAECFGWAFHLDWSAPEETARAWYVSEEKLEPRLGERFDEPIAEYEQPLAPARDAVRAFEAMADRDPAEPVATFLLQHPDHRQLVRRAQINALAPDSEIRDNTISADLLPIDMLRAKLSFFGATHFDPRSDRWVRICMFAGAPYPEDLNEGNADFWVYPDQQA